MKKHSGSTANPTRLQMEASTQTKITHVDSLSPEMPHARDAKNNLNVTAARKRSLTVIMDKPTRELKEQFPGRYGGHVSLSEWLERSGLVRA